MDHVKTQEKDARNNLSQKVIYIALSAVLPLLILLIRPFEMDMRQSATLAVLLLVIIWWCTGIVGKTLASCVLIVSFLFLSGAQPRTVFSFPALKHLFADRIDLFVFCGALRTQVLRKSIWSRFSPTWPVLRSRR